ncbi:hypothetical protein LTR16_000485, partial [Cryomyces antarcticus]
NKVQDEEKNKTTATASPWKQPRPRLLQPPTASPIAPRRGPPTRPRAAATLPHRRREPRARPPAPQAQPCPTVWQLSDDMADARRSPTPSLSAPPTYDIGDGLTWRRCDSRGGHGDGGGNVGAALAPSVRVARARVDTLRRTAARELESELALEAAHAARGREDREVRGGW